MHVLEVILLPLIVSKNSQAKSEYRSDFTIYFMAEVPLISKIEKNYIMNTGFVNEREAKGHA